MINNKWNCAFRKTRSILINTDLFIATDGSARDNTATFTWIMCDPNGERLMSNTGVFNGKAYYLYCPESMATVSILYFLHYFASFPYKQKTTIITLFTENESFLKGYKTFSHYSHIGATPMPQYMCAEQKLLNEIHQLLQKLTFTIKFTSVKSHQDGKLEYTKLDLPAQLNVDIYILADDCRLQTLSSPLHSPMYYHQQDVQYD